MVAEYTLFIRILKQMSVILARRERNGVYTQACTVLNGLIILRTALTAPPRLPVLLMTASRLQ